METKKFEIDGKKILVGTAKLVVGTAAGIGAGIVAKKFLKGSLDSNAKTIEKVVTAIGIAGLAAAAGEVAQNQVEKDIDMVEKAIDAVSKIFSKFADKEDVSETSTDEETKES